MSDDSHSTIPGGRQDRLIEAAMRQLETVARSVAVEKRAVAPRPPALPPDAFPGYRIIEEIHRGGQGVVYQALQESTQRLVAVKVLRESQLLAAADIARFEQEVRILGRLRHPNIVRIYDSRVSDGRFYYVMDYIAGRPLDTYVSETHLPADGLVRLFVKICEAVHAAHLLGIIHRDLKPGNIRIDAAGEPYVLDFGLSKLAGDDDSSMTLTGQFVGSAPWASPEQAAGRTDTIDLRSDVYSLGVLLYQMLTGRFPYQVRGTPGEVLSQVLGADPTPPRRHLPSLSSDLETITLKCLQKEPERRYQSAGDLARDLERYLAREPIEARRDSLSYVIRKQLVRHKFAALSAAGFLALLIGGLLTTVTLWRQAVSARDLAEKQSLRAIAKESEAREAAEKAAREARNAAAIADFLRQMIVSANPYEGGTRDVRVADTLAAARDRLDRQSGTMEPELEANLRRLLGSAFAALGLFDDAGRQLESAHTTFADKLGPAHVETIDAAITLAVVRRSQGRAQEARELLVPAVAAAEKARGRSDDLTLTAINELGGALSDLGKHREAEPLYREALAVRRERLGPDHADTNRSANDLALLLDDSGNYAEAKALLMEVIEAVRRTQGAKHPALAVHLANLGGVETRLGNLEDAERLYQESRTLFREALGDRHPQYVQLLNAYGSLCRVRQRYDEAEALFREAIALNTEQLGPRHVRLGANYHNLAITLISLSRFEEAEEAIREALDIFTESYGPNSDPALSSLTVMGAACRARGDLPEAERVLREVLDARIARNGADHAATLNVQGNLAMVLLESDRLDEAEPIFVELLEKHRVALGDEHPDTLVCLERVATCAQRRGRLAEAEAQVRQAIEGYRKLKQTVSEARTTNQLGLVLGDAGRLEEAEAAHRQAIEASRTVLPERHHELVQFRLNHGLALHRLGRSDEGLPEAAAALETLTELLGAPHPTVRRARERVAAAFEEHGDAEAAARLRDKL